VVQLSPATMGWSPAGAPGRVVVVGHGGPHRCSAELGGASGFGCADIPSFRVQGGPGLNARAVGPGGWCVPGHSQVGFAYYREQIAASQQILGTFDLDAPCAWPEMADQNLRWVALHMIEEAARHAGHAYIIRETIDGSRGF